MCGTVSVQSNSYAKYNRIYHVYYSVVLYYSVQVMSSKFVTGKMKDESIKISKLVGNKNLY